MTFSNQKSKLIQLNPALLQNLSDEQTSTLEGGATIALALIFITAELDRSSTKYKGAAGLGLGIGGS